MVRTRLRQLGLAALLLMPPVLIWWVSGPRVAAAPRAPAVVPAAAADGTSLHSGIAPGVSIPPALIRFALNALLVPLLDDAVPPHWTDATIDHICGPGTRVRIDGRPLERHMPMPARAFSVHWTLDRCLPFGFESVELSGDVALHVFHEDDGLGAIVVPGRLRVDSHEGRAWLERPFTAAMTLASARRDGD